MNTDDIINLMDSGWGTSEILTEIQHRHRVERWQAADMLQEALRQYDAPRMETEPDNQPTIFEQ